MMLGHGSWGLRNSEDGVNFVRSVKVMRQFCFAMEIRVSTRPLRGKDYSRGREVASCLRGDNSSLVVDRLFDKTRGQHTAVTCFYFDFAARKEQTATSMLGSLLKQMVSGMRKIPEEVWRTLREQKEANSWRKLQLGDIVKMLQLITHSQRTFMCLDALDECTPVQRFRLLDSLKEILEKSEDARIFVTGRPHIKAEIEARFAGRVTSVSVGLTGDDIV